VNQGAHELAAASAWVERFVPRIAPGARVLDLAAGSGRHARLLVAAGFEVTAVDRDAAALARCEGAQTVVADLENAAWPLAGAQFGAIVVTNYLHRPLWGALLSALAPRGVLIYETFARGQEQIGRPARAEFLLNPGELLEVCRNLHVLAYEDGLIGGTRAARVQRICALNDRDIAAGPQILL
jgi:SAM-dependent methyltransferase